jgi:thioesterase domain-containing protein/acyl carrier protein
MTSDLRSAPADAGSSAARKNIEDVLPLLANQHVLVLFSGLPGDEDPGFLQVRFTLTGTLDEQRFTQAWGRVVAQHPALRASIHERDGRPPLAVVRRRVAVPVDVRDWRSLDPQEQATALESLLDEDRQRGLDFAVAPAMRVSVVRMTDTRAEVVWTCHHILIDGWSSAIVLEDLMQAYHSLGAGSAPPAGPAGPARQDALRSYVQWITGRDSAATEDYWRRRLDDFEGAESLLVDMGAPHSGPEYTSHAVDLSEALTVRLRELATATHVTANTVFLAAWSVVASLLTGEGAPVFGTTVSGRTAPVDGLERLVGYLSNAVPVRIEVQPELTVAAWLQGIRDQQFEMQSHEHATLDDIARWCSVPGHRRLFETFLVVENFPLSDPHGTDLSLSGFQSGLTTASPVTIAVGMGDPWSIHLRYDTRRVSARGARAITDQFIATLEAVAQEPDRTVAEVRQAAGDRVGALVTRVIDDRTDFVAPRTQTEQVLTEIWASLLDRPDIGVSDDWFAIGGSSLAAVGLFGAISDRFGVDLPLNTLLAHPTIEALGCVLDGPSSVAGERRCLIAIHAEGNRAPLVGIHGGRGGVLFYHKLWERLGPDQPMYVLEPVGMDGVTKPLKSVPAMAARYVSELREVQPSGPYQLVGFCFGGPVALEMAGLLEAAGEEVALVAVIDGGLPVDPARTKSAAARAVTVYRKRGALGTLRTAQARIANRGRDQSRRPSQPNAVGWDGDIGGEGEGGKPVYGSIARACRRAFRTYEPKPVSAPILLIRSSWDQGGEGRDWHVGWGEYTPSYAVATVDAHHKDIFEMPAVESLAAIIRAHTGTRDEV